MRRAFLEFSLERVGLLLILLLVGCGAGSRPAVTSPALALETAPMASTMADSSPGTEPDVKDLAAMIADDAPDGPVRFYTDSRSRARKVRFLPGEAIDAQLSLDAPLSSLRGHPTFELQIRLYSKAGNGWGRCRDLTIDGSTKAGAQALVSRMLTVSIIPGLHDDALLATGCEAQLRALMLGDEGAASGEIRGELQLSVSTSPVSGPSQTSTLGSGRFRLDLAGGPAAIAKGLATLDDVHEQERRDAIPTNRMPRSKMAALEPAAMKVVQLEIADSSTTEFRPLRVVITARVWTVLRDPKSMLVLDRRISGSVAFRRPDTTCFSAEVTFSEDFDGTRYQAMVVDLPRLPDGVELLCENVWK